MCSVMYIIIHYPIADTHVITNVKFSLFTVGLAGSSESGGHRLITDYPHYVPPIGQVSAIGARRNVQLL